MPKFLEQKPFVIIIGLESIQALQTARILARHGIPVMGMTDDPGHFDGQFQRGWASSEPQRSK